MTRRVEERLRGAELEPVDVERVGDAGGDGDAELVEVQRLPGDRAALPLMVGSRSARRWPTRASAARTLSRAMAASTPWLRPERDRLEQRERALRHGRLLRGDARARRPGPSRRATGARDACGVPQLAIRGAREHAVEIEIDQPLERLLVAQRLRDRRGGRSTARGPCGPGARGARGRANPCGLGRNSPVADAPLEHLLDQAAGAQDHFVKVEPGQLREVARAPPGPRGRSGVISSSRMRVYMPRDQLDQEVAGGASMRADSASPSASSGDDLGAHHLAEERFLGVEVEVDGALAHAGEAGDVVDLGAGEAGLAEDRQGGIENLVGACLGPALPAGRGERAVESGSDISDSRMKLITDRSVI